MEKLDKNSPVPLYYQLYTILLNDIRNGVLKPGDMLPTEVSLMEKYNISRATARQAILDLVQKGYVVRKKSRGTFVKDSSASLSYLDKITGFAAVSSLHGRVELTSKVLAQEVIAAPASICGPLKLNPGSRVFYIKRIRSIEGTPTVYTEDWIPYELCDGIEKLDFTDKSLLSVLEKNYNVTPLHAIRSFECCMADTEEQLTELKVRQNHPMLSFTSLVLNDKNEPIEYCNAIINGKYTVIE